MGDVTPDPIMRIALGYMAAKHLFVASAIGLFESLAGGPATLDELATKCGVPRRTLGISIDAMASLGLVERDGECYFNSTAAAAFLAGTPGRDLRPMLRYIDRISYGQWMNLEAAVRAGEGRRQFSGFSAEQQQIFSAGVEAFTAASALALAENYDFGRHRRVLDVAGGTGSFLIPILRRYPPVAPLMSGEFLVMSGEGQAYGEYQADAWLGQTGWRKLERRPLAEPASVIIAQAV
jgi:hypothetical protein